MEGIGTRVVSIMQYRLRTRSYIGFDHHLHATAGLDFVHQRRAVGYLEHGGFAVEQVGDACHSNRIADGALCTDDFGEITAGGVLKALNPCPTWYIIG